MKTNRDYYSWSQHSLWKSSKMQFYKRYVLGEDGPRLDQFDKGSEFADFRETGEKPHYVDDPMIEAVNSQIPRIGKSELKLEVQFGHINLLAFLDECQEDLKKFLEFKTGKVPWTQKKVEAHKQLDFYAACIYIKSGETIIPECELIWIETEEFEVNGETKLRYTGYFERFTKKFTKEDIENIAADIYSTYNEIQEYEHTELEADDNTVDRYIELLEKKKEVQNEITLIQLKMLDEMKAVGATYISNEKGRFSISQRKTPIYSTELLTKEKQYKDEIDKLKQKEKDSPTTKYSISESVRFTKSKK